LTSTEWSLRNLLLHLDITQGLLLDRAKQIIREDNPLLLGVSAWMLQNDAMTGRDLFQRYTT
jgi:hypothetical protein